MTAAKVRVRSYPIIETVYGPVRGTDDGTVAAWKGIRYAAPPVDELRWRAPRPPQPWTEIADATLYGAVCPQPDSPVPLGTGTRSSEDCLFVNVWAPSQMSSDAPAGGAAKPVMVWLHGGAYLLGASSQPLYDGRSLAARDVVVVSINYRLGAFGFLELGGLGGAEQFDTNVGIRDAVLALQWVQDNIARFGGDPQQVTLFGESAGAGIVTTLLTAPAAAGLFHRAIAQSSPATSAYDGERGRRVAEMLLGRLGVSVDEARSVPVEALVEASYEVFDHVPSSTPGTLAFAPIVDGDLIPDYPIKLAREGRSHPVPLIIGTNRDEAALFRWMKSPLMPIAPKTIRTMFDEIATEQPELAIPTDEEIEAAYPGVRPRARGLHVARDVGFRMPTLWLAEGHSAVAPVYLYRFDWATTMLRVLRLGAAHATELPYVWGNLVMGSRDVTFKLGGLKAGRTLSDRIQGRWVNFARGQEPVGPAGEPWRRFTPEDRATLLIDREDSVVEDLDREIRAAWGDEVLSFR